MCVCVCVQSSKDRAISYERAWPNEKNEEKMEKEKVGNTGERAKKKGRGWGRNIYIYRRLGEEGGRRQKS